MLRKPHGFNRVIMSVVVFFLVSVHCWAAEEKGHTVVNLAANPSIEQPDPADGTRPASFSSAHAGKSRKAKFTWAEPGHTGNKCVSVQTMDSDDIGYWKITVPVKPQTEYLVSFYYKCRSATRGDIGKADPLYHMGRPGGPNIELGVVPESGMKTRKPTNWTDTIIPLGTDGGTYLPLVTEWTLHRQTVRTVAGQKRMEIKLRLFCYIQKVWFDDLSVVELPVNLQAIPKDQQITECSTSPVFGPDTTQRFDTKEKLSEGLWFIRTGVLDQNGLACWLTERIVKVGPSKWLERDTTPPVVNAQTPLPGISAEEDTTISAKFSDADSGINLSSARILLDGEDVSKYAKVTKKGFTLKPQRSLAKGVHKVEVTVADKAGNRSNRLVWRFGVGTVALLETRFEKGKFIVNDEPYFPVGIYAHSCFPNDEGRFRESILAEAALAGYDCLLNSSVKEEHLAILQKHRIKNLPTLIYDMMKIKDAASAKKALVEEGQLQFNNHPTTLTYWSEPLGHKDYKMMMKETEKVLGEYVPNRPLIYCASDETKWKSIFSNADITIVYRYPVPYYHPKMIYEWTLYQAFKLAGDKPIWFLPQAFSHAVDRTRGKELVSKQNEFRPTVPEMRAMTYYSAVLGVNGIIQYACYLPHSSLPSIWKEILKEGGELRYLSQVLAAGRDVSSVSLKKDSTHGSIFFREIEYNGLHTLIAVNLSGGRVMAHWQFEKPTRAIVLFEDRLMAEPAQEVPDLFEPFEVHLYQW